MRHMDTGILLIIILSLSFSAYAGDRAEMLELVSQASEAYDAGRFEACGTFYSRALEQGARFQYVPYSAACCYALNGDAERAFELLDLAVERGWRDVAHLESDGDLETLHGDERWKNIVKRAKERWEAYANSVNRELLVMYEEDQGDRSGQIDWSVVAPRDEKRRKRVKEIVEAGEAKTADDYYHAAMVLQHGQEPEDYELAHELSVRASELDPDHPSARWLAAAAKDRYLHSIGESQIYGTQFRMVDGKWTLDPIDETAVDDEERAKWGVPPLAEAKQRAESMNR